MSLSEEQEAKHVLLCQSTSKVGAGGREEGGEGRRGYKSVNLDITHDIEIYHYV